MSERGSGRSPPRVQTLERVTAGCTTSRPSSRASSTPSGRRLSIDSAPTSTATPPTSARRSLPPASAARLEDLHVGAVQSQGVRRGQTGQASADDHHAAHPDTFPDPAWGAGASDRNRPDAGHVRVAMTTATRRPTFRRTIAAAATLAVLGLVGACGASGSDSATAMVATAVGGTSGGSDDSTRL